MPSILDVAQRAGVSIATVSRVLNRSSAVLPETQQQVLTAIDELGYKPLRSPRQSKIANIMVLIPDITNSFYSNIVKGIGEYCIKTDRNMLLCNTNYSRRRELEFVEMMENKVAQGAIFLGPELQSEEIMQLNSQYPIVQCCEYIEGLPVTHISIDNRVATDEVMRHLIGLGHTKIGLIACNNSFLSTRFRVENYHRNLENNALEARPEYIITTHSYEFKSGLRAMKQLLQLPDPPTAVFALSDLMAIGAISAVISAGLRVPEDVAVVGFDDIEFAAMYTPSLTTVAQPCYDLGYDAMDLLAKKLDGQSVPEAVYLEHELKIRSSTVRI